MSSHHRTPPHHATPTTTRLRARSTHIRLRTSLALLALLAATSAHAGTSGNVSLTSDYIFRGVSQSNQQPALQGGIEYAAGSGLYAGSWGSSIHWLSDLSTTVAPISSRLELDVYGGYRGKFSDAMRYDIGALYYTYPGSFPDGFNCANTLELYAGLTITASEKLQLGAKYSLATTDLFGYVDSSGSGYLDISANYALAEGWSVSAHAGKQWIKGNTGFAYNDWKLGLTRSFSNAVSVGLAYAGTDADDALYTNPFGRQIARDSVALTLTKTL
jgi:uncharacterized protein (TIGR02001 family)